MTSIQGLRGLAVDLAAGATTKKSFAAGSVAALLAVAAAAPASAGLIDPNDPALAPYTLTYGDFQVISLQFADTGTNSNEYYVASSPGQLRNTIVVGTGAGGSYGNDGSAPVNHIDEPYPTPNSTPHTQTSFQTALTTDPAPSFPGASLGAGDTPNTWDANLGQLNVALGGGPAVFYFNLNETGTDNLLSGTDLVVWAAASVVDPNGNTVQTFYLAGNPFDFAPTTGTCANTLGHYGACLSDLNGGPSTAAPLADNDLSTSMTYGVTGIASDPRWSLVHGNICVNGSTFLHYGACVMTDPAGSQTVNQNLGANQAAFAVYNSTLDSLIQNAAYAGYTLQIDWRMNNEDNGYEQLFIASPTTNIPVPEPLSLALFGTGLGVFGLLGMVRRRRRAA